LDIADERLVVNEASDDDEPDDWNEDVEQTGE